MVYSSGKTRISKQICDVISQNTYHDCTLVSLFCGGLSVEKRLSPYFKKIICNDKQEYLIEFYKAIQNGYMPPKEISVEQYKFIKQNMDENKALAGFVGFGCSFGGKWWGGYARHGNKGKHAEEKTPCEEAYLSIERDKDFIKSVDFFNLDYTEVNIPENSIIYADPPYKGKMASYGIAEKFDTENFWDYMRKISKNHKVYISELEAPEDFECIWEKPVLRQIANCNSKNFSAREKLYIYKGEK